MEARQVLDAATMRSLLFLIVLGALAYGGYRWYAGRDANSTSEPDAVANAADGIGAPPEVSAPPVAASLGDSARQAVERAAQSGVLGDLAAEVSRLAKEGNTLEREISALMLDACEAKQAGARWTALSRLADHQEVDAKSQARFAALAANSAKEGVLKGDILKVRVQKGDSLAKICKRAQKDQSLNVTPGMLRWLNGIPGDRIKPDQELAIPRGELRVVVSKSRFRLDLWLGGGIVRSYAVALGREEKTPIFDFVVESKLEKPPWDDPTTGKRIHYGEPGYALGTRWLGFNDAEGHAGLGIHGTDDPGSIGTNASLGCVRLRNPDVEDLFELVPLRAKVSIRN